MLLVSKVVRLYANHLVPGLTGAVREGLTKCLLPPQPRDLLNDCLCCCFQVRGHHIAKLDPLGISCVNFDDAPVTVSSNVGEDPSANANVNVILLFFTPSLFFFSCPFVCVLPSPSLALP